MALYPEARSALARALRAKRVPPRAAERNRRRLETLWDTITQITFDDAVARRAGELADRLHLRAYDAIHLASLEAARSAETVFVSADARQLVAAQALGFTVVAAV